MNKIDYLSQIIYCRCVTWEREFDRTWLVHEHSALYFRTFKVRFTLKRQCLKADSQLYLGAQTFPKNQAFPSYKFLYSATKISPIDVSSHKAVYKEKCMWKTSIREGCGGNVWSLNFCMRRYFLWFLFSACISN